MSSSSAVRPLALHTPTPDTDLCDIVTRSANIRPARGFGVDIHHPGKRMFDRAEKAVSIAATLLPPGQSFLSFPLSLSFHSHLFFRLFDRARQAFPATLQGLFQSPRLSFRLFERIELVTLMFKSFLHELILNVLLMTKGESLTDDLRVLRVDVQRLCNTAFPLL